MHLTELFVGSSRFAPSLATFASFAGVALIAGNQLALCFLPCRCFCLFSFRCHVQCLFSFSSDLQLHRPLFHLCLVVAPNVPPLPPFCFLLSWCALFVLLKLFSTRPPSPLPWLLPIFSLLFFPLHRRHCVGLARAHNPPPCCSARHQHGFRRGEHRPGGPSHRRPLPQVRHVRAGDGGGGGGAAPASQRWGPQPEAPQPGAVRQRGVATVLRAVEARQRGQRQEHHQLLAPHRCSLHAGAGTSGSCPSCLASKTLEYLCMTTRSTLSQVIGTVYLDIGFQEVAVTDRVATLFFIAGGHLSLSHYSLALTQTYTHTQHTHKRTYIGTHARTQAHTHTHMIYSFSHPHSLHVSLFPPDVDFLAGSPFPSWQGSFLSWPSQECPRTCRSAASFRGSGEMVPTERRPTLWHQFCPTSTGWLFCPPSLLPSSTFWSACTKGMHACLGHLLPFLVAPNKSSLSPTPRRRFGYFLLVLFILLFTAESFMGLPLVFSLFSPRGVRVEWKRREREGWSGHPVATVLLCFLQKKPILPPSLPVVGGSRFCRGPRRRILRALALHAVCRLPASSASDWRLVDLAALHILRHLLLFGAPVQRPLRPDFQLRREPELSGVLPQRAQAMAFHFFPAFLSVVPSSLSLSL